MHLLYYTVFQNSLISLCAWIYNMCVCHTYWRWVCRQCLFRCCCIPHANNSCSTHSLKLTFHCNYIKMSFLVFIFLNTWWICRNYMHIKISDISFSFQFSLNMLLSVQNVETKFIAILYFSSYWSVVFSFLLLLFCLFYYII